MEKEFEYDLTILMPAYNEGIAVATTVKKLRQLYPNAEILVVDDGSTDNTAGAAEHAGATVYRQPYNIGNGAAVKAGIRRAKGEYIVMMDADGQHAPDDIASLLVHKGKYDMVVGARTKDSQTSLHRDIANKFYNYFASYVTKFNIKDLTSGFRLIRTSVARDFVLLLPNTFSYPTTLTMACLRSGLTVKYVPIVTKYRLGKSKIKLVQDGARFFLIITKVATLFSPFRVFLPVSAGLFTLGVLYYIYTYCSVGRFTNMSALLFTTSVIIFMIGLVSEQVTQLRYELTRKKEK